LEHDRGYRAAGSAEFGKPFTTTRIATQLPWQVGLAQERFEAAVRLEALEQRETLAIDEGEVVCLTARSGQANA
jgi:hypothetical protein